jgi:hypothetical protein
VHHKAFRVYEVAVRERRLQHVVALDSLSMASSVFYYFTCGNDNTVVAWIAAILIFTTGVFYCVIGCCFSERFEKPSKEELIT